MLLRGWKQIAAYLKCGVRTAERWHHELQLPVIRIRESSVSPVMAESEMIDEWIRGRLKSGQPHHASLPFFNHQQGIELQKNAAEFVSAEIGLGCRFADLASCTKDENLRTRRVNAARKAYDVAKRTIYKPRLLEEAERLRLLPELTNLQSILEELGQEF